MTTNLLILSLGAYLVGSIPTGYLVAKLAGVSDIRNFGSGNMGATNVARVLGVQFFFMVVLIDAFKAYLYLRYAQSLSLHSRDLSILAVSLLAGNVFPVFLGFRGGKGVATCVGIVAALMPSLFFYLFGIWAAVLALTRTVGVASVVGCLALPIIACYQYGLLHVYSWLSVSFTISILITHRDNIVRFLQDLSF